MTMTEEEIIKMAAKTGANAGIEAFKREQQRAIKGANDKRFRNTELLLKHYKAFKDSAKLAVYRAEDCESLEDIIADLMMPGRAVDVTVKSIKESAARTAIIVEHIERMLLLYENYCKTVGKPEEERRWRIIDGLYIQEQRQSISALAKQEHVSERQIYEDRSKAISKIAVYMFGIDFISGGRSNAV